jgi:purine-binding chemotaxis protein CheW
MTPPAAAARAPVQAVTFALGKEEFAVPVPFVREILDWREPFAIPNAPVHFIGLIDVRGQGIPVLDLRLRLGLPPAPTTTHTRILVLELAGGTIAGTGPLVVGLVIDRALCVSAFAGEAIETSPDIGVPWRSAYIEGVMRREGGFVVLIDIARILTSEDTTLIARDTARAA